MHHVVIVEDEPWIRRAMVKMVEELFDGMLVVAGEAENAEEGLRLIQEIWPTVLITDIRMPGKDGIWLVREIAERQLPIATIISTGHSEFSYAQQAIRYGVSDFLLKPVFKEELEVSIRKALDHRRGSAAMREHLQSMQRLLRRAEDTPVAELVKQQNLLIKALWSNPEISEPERRIILQLFSGHYEEKIRSFDTGYAWQPMEAETQDQAINHFFKLAEKWAEAAYAATNGELRSSIHRACRYIEDHYGEELSLPHLAALANLSVSHFCLVFKRQTGLSYTQYLSNCRINRAKELLMDGEMKVYEIAEAVGFRSLPNFNRAFRQAEGCSPNACRGRLRV